MDVTKAAQKKGEATGQSRKTARVREYVRKGTQRRKGEKDKRVRSRARAAFSCALARFSPFSLLSRTRVLPRLCACTARLGIARSLSARSPAAPPDGAWTKPRLSGRGPTRRQQPVHLLSNENFTKHTQKRIQKSRLCIKNGRDRLPVARLFLFLFFFEIETMGRRRAGRRGRTRRQRTPIRM